MTQYVINIGAVPNDGTGDPLRTAFNEVNLNFNQVWATGLVGSNIAIANNTIRTTNTNGNLVLAPNGVGVVQSNVSIVPNTPNIRNLGSATQRWDTVYAQYANIAGTINVAGDLTVNGNLSVIGNVVQIGNLVTDAKTIQLANTAGTANAANGSGVTVGANDAIATFLFNSASNSWATNIGLNVTGNILPSANVTYNLGSNTAQWKDLWVSNSTIYMNSVPITLGTGNVLTVNGNAVLTNNSNTTVSTTGNVTADYFFGNGSQLTGLPAQYSNANVATFLAAFGSNTISTTGNVTVGNILPAGYVSAVGNVRGANFNTDGAVSAVGNVTGNYFIGNGSQLTGLSTSSISNGLSNVAIPTANGNVTVTANGSSTWNFATDGNLTTPSNLVIGPGPGSGSSILQYNDTLQIVGEGANAAIIIGWAANQSAPDSVATIAMNFPGSGEGNVFIAVGNNATTVNYWKFGTDGQTIFPTLTVTRGDRTGTLTGQALIFGDSTQEAIISTPNGTNDINASQRLVINPGAGAANTAGEGGDIYLYAGRGGDLGGSGGDIKIRGGLGPVDGAGGYLDIQGGDTQGNGTGGYVDIRGGESGNAAGGAVNLYGGYGPAVGGIVSITGGQSGTGAGGDVGITGGVGGNGLPTYGNVNIASGASTWRFDNTGNLTIPGNILGNGNILIAPDSANSGGYLDIYLTTGPDVHVASNSDSTLILGRDDYANVTVNVNGNVSVQASTGSSPSVWTFDTDGVLNLPGEGVLQSTNDTVTLRSFNTTTGNANSVYLGTSGGLGFGDTAIGGNWLEIFRSGTDPQIATPSNLLIRSDSTNTAPTWTFGANGNLTAPGNVIANTFVSNAFNVVTAGNLFISSQYGLGTVGTILEQDGLLEFIGNSTGGCVLVGWNNSYGNQSNVAQIYFNRVGGGEGNAILTTGNLAATSYEWNFDKTGTLTAPGNITTAGTGGDITLTGGNITGANVITANTFVGDGSQISNVATQSTGSWTLSTGVNTVSFTVGGGATYSMWVNGNIPNGIVVWNATVTLTNTNVPAIGQQFAWFYETGNALVLTSIPSQIIGTAGAISNAAPVVANTNVFTFSITNNSGNSQVVNYGWTKIG